jgi:hypothetical protein
MANNTAYCNYVEELILTDNLLRAGVHLSDFLINFNFHHPDALAQDLLKQLSAHDKTLMDLNDRLRQKNISESEVAATEKTVWVALHHINNQVRNMPHFDAKEAEKAAKPTFTYAPEPQTWRDAPWLPLLIAGSIVAVAFTVGIRYNNATLKAQKAAQQAEIDAKNGIKERYTEGSLALKLLEEKTTSGLDGQLVLTINKVHATDSTLELSVKTKNTSKIILQNNHFSMIDIAQKETEIPAIAITDIDSSLDKKIRFNYAIGAQRKFLLLCKVTTTDTQLEKTIGVPFELR